MLHYCTYTIPNLNKSQKLAFLTVGATIKKRIYTIDDDYIDTNKNNNNINVKSKLYLAGVFECKEALHSISYLVSISLLIFV